MGLLDNFMAAGFQMSKSVFGTEPLDFGNGVILQGVRDEISVDRDVAAGFRMEGSGVSLIISLEDAAKVPALETVARCTFAGAQWNAKAKSKGKAAWTIQLDPLTKRESAT